MSRFDIHVQKSLPGFRLDARLQTDAARVVIIGGSGSGKTLFMQAVAGLYRPDGGHIRICERVFYDGTTNLPTARRNVAYLFQDYALFPHLTVAQNIAFGLHGGWRNPGRRQLQRGWSACTLPTLPTPTRRNSPADKSSALPSPARSSAAQRCSCLTNPSRRSIPACAPKCGNSSARYNANTACRSSSSPTTPPMPKRSAMPSGK